MVLAILFQPKIVLNKLKCYHPFYCVGLSDVMIKTEQKCGQSGFSIQGQIILNLSYTDDITLTKSDLNVHQIFLNLFPHNSKEIGLELIIKKTVSMTTKHNQNLTFK